MCAQDAGSNRPASPLEYFEWSIRPREESTAPIPALSIDDLLGFDGSDDERLAAALKRRCPAGHWALERSNFGYILEQAMQLLSGGLCGLANRDFTGGHPLECCARIVRSPMLSPYIVQAAHSYVIVPTGFVSSLESFISSSYALATVAAAQVDPRQETAVWDRDILLGSIAGLAERDLPAFTRGAMEAALETVQQQVLDDFCDLLAFVAFDRNAQAQMAEMLPPAAGWRRLGFDSLKGALSRYPSVRDETVKIARLALCFASCHEFGHSFPLAMEGEDARKLATDEAFADSLGTMILYRLLEDGVLAEIIGAAVTPRDLGHALGAFHSWNLGKELGGLLTAREDAGNEAALSRICEVSCRWEAAMVLVQKVWTDRVSALAHLDEPPTTGFMIVNHWGLVPAGLLRAALWRNGHSVGIERACDLLSLLAKRDSKLYAYLAGEGEPQEPPGRPP